MTTRRRGIEPRSAQRITVMAVTGALLMAGVALANTAGGADATSSVQVIRTTRTLETPSPTPDAVRSQTPDTGLTAPGQTARPLDPSAQPEEPSPTPGRMAPAPKSTLSDRGGESGKPKSDAGAPKDDGSGEADDHETVKPPVRDEDDEEGSDSDVPKTNDDDSERKVQRQGE